MRREEDFILRQIAELAHALHLVTGLARTQQYQAALRVVDDQAARLLGVPTSQLETLTEAEVLARVRFGVTAELAQQQTALLAALLAEAGQVYGSLRDPDQAESCFLAAVHLALAAHRTAAPPAETPSIPWLVGALGPDRLPPDTQLALLEHYERAGEFALAEDTFFRLLADTPNPQIRLLGQALFTRLLTLDDAALTAGSLSRAEVQAALREVTE